jgi:N-acetylmuramoyl-L-alanine amidase
MRNMLGPLPIRWKMSPNLVLCVALLFACGRAGWGQLLSPLAPQPNWVELEQYQQTITREEFTRLLADVYAPNDAAREVIEIGADAAQIKTTLNPPATWTLRFAGTAAEAKPAPRFWKTPAELGPAPEGRPLAGVKIAIDPGHLGGTWAKMEQRFFQIGESRPVVEGDMTLRVAKMLVPRLQALGAEVQLVRESNEPVTQQRPDTLRPIARQQAGTPEAVASAEKDEAELLFYRVSEIRERARIVNEKIRPDLTLCLHFNAEAWGNPAHPEFVPRNHLHILLNGCYSADELRHDDVRFDMLQKLLGRCFPSELAAGTAAASAMAKATDLPAYSYTTNNALMMAGNRYLWARNLLANRLYHTPVVYFEPYVMNSEVTWERVQAGDYDGEYLIGGVMRKSIFREYVEGVVEGVKEYYGSARK